MKSLEVDLFRAGVTFKTNAHPAFTEALVVSVNVRFLASLSLPWTQFGHVSNIHLSLNRKNDSDSVFQVRDTHIHVRGDD